MTVRGLVGALDLSRRAASPEQRVVLPHEGIHPDQVADLADRMFQMQVNPAPILLVTAAPRPPARSSAGLLDTKPDHEFTDRAEQRNRIWAIRSPEQLTELADALAGCRALIADGHHRYAAYLRMQQEHPGGATDRGLAMLVDQDDTPLFLGAIHRVLRGTTFDTSARPASGLADFRPTTEAQAVVRPRRRHARGHRRPAVGRAPALPRGRPGVRGGAPRAGLPKPPHPPRRIAYHHSVEDTLGDLPTRNAVAVLMPAPDYDLVRRAVTGEHLLPEKATSFQPKPSLGVLMRSLRDE